MRTALVFVAAALGAQLVVAAQQLTDSEIEKAIMAGQNKKLSQLISVCIATAGFGENMAAGLVGGVQPNGSFTVVVSANAGRIAFLARESKRLYRSFSLGDVPNQLRIPAVFVFVDPSEPRLSQGTVSVAAPLERVVLKSKTKPDAVVQPESFEIELLEWSNLLGGKVQGTRALALFPMEAARNLPPGDVDIVVVTQAGERRCKVGNKDRDRLFPANQ